MKTDAAPMRWKRGTTQSVAETLIAVAPIHTTNTEKGNALALILTRHNLHGEQVGQALAAGHHVFVEKPPAIRQSEIWDIDDVARVHPDRIVPPGFNGRFAPATRAVRAL